VILDASVREQTREVPVDPASGSIVVRVLRLSSFEFRTVDHAAPTVASGPEMGVKHLVEDDERDDVARHDPLIERRMHSDQAMLRAPRSQPNRTPSPPSHGSRPADPSPESTAEVGPILARDDRIQIVVAASQSQNARAAPTRRAEEKPIRCVTHELSRGGVAGADQVRHRLDHSLAFEGELPLDSDPEDAGLQTAPRDEGASIVGSDQIDRLAEHSRQPSVPLLHDQWGHHGAWVRCLQGSAVPTQGEPKLKRL
jgi:hypothetical protein